MAVPGAGAPDWGGESPEDFFRRKESENQRKSRRRKPRGRKPPRMRAGSYAGVAAPGDDLGQAAKVVADEAARLASEWSSTIPGSIRVEVSGNTATVWTDAPAAYPNEVEGVRHPVYGPAAGNPHPAWVTNEYRPFMAPAADAKATAAMERYERRWTRLLEQAGFKPA